MAKSRAPVLIKLDGARQLRRTLKDAEANLDDLKDINREAANIGLNAARPAIPVLTGRLAGSARAAGTKTAAIIRFGTKAIPYANPIHWGWPKRNIAANKFGIEPVRAVEPRIQAVYLDGIQQILDTIQGES